MHVEKIGTSSGVISRYITSSEIELGFAVDSKIIPAVTWQITDQPTVTWQNSQMVELKFHHTDCFSVCRYGSLQHLSSCLGCQCDSLFQFTCQKPNIH